MYAFDASGFLAPLIIATPPISKPVPSDGKETTRGLPCSIPKTQSCEKTSPTAVSPRPTIPTGPTPLFE